MSDAYGKLFFSSSEGTKLNTKKIVAILNQYSWECWDGDWAINKNKIYYDGNTVQNPTVYPSEEKSITLKIDGVETKICPSEFTNDLEKFIWDTEFDTVPIKKLRDSLAGFINDGWIQISCIANEKNRYQYSQELRIYSDSRAYRKNSCISSSKYYPTISEEEFMDAYTTDKAEVY